MTSAISATSSSRMSRRVFGSPSPARSNVCMGGASTLGRGRAQGPSPGGGFFRRHPQRTGEGVFRTRRNSWAARGGDDRTADVADEELDPDIVSQLHRALAELAPRQRTAVLLK